jgi:3-hydroxyisobutyrate dehydrogenase-like beta-hydroxyacid dehydrogenase
MSVTVAIVAPGAMGAGIGRSLASCGVRVLTSLIGRSEASAARARAAGMIAASDEEIAAADFVLSILPPGDALALAQRFAPALAASNAKTVYVDCNAINPATVEKVAGIVAPTGCAFVDAGIIGPPPSAVPSPRTGESANVSGPRLYVSGPAAPRLATLRQYGLDVRVLEGPLSAASALKMCYGGINKGSQALGAAMMLAAMRAGVAAALHDELSFSQKEMLAQFRQQLPKMPAKAYRWIAEMQEIAGFVGDDPAAAALYESAARFFQQMAEDFAGERQAAAALERFLSEDPR